MKHKLKKEIVSYFYESIGLIDDYLNKSPIDVNLVSDDFVLEKKVSFQEEDESITHCNVWGAQAKLNDVIVKIIFANVGNDNEPDFVCIFKMNDFPAYGFKIDGDDATFMLRVDSNWIVTDIGIQTKFAAGISDLMTMFPKWERLKDIDDMYALLLTFI